MRVPQQGLAVVFVLIFLVPVVALSSSTVSTAPTVVPVHEGLHLLCLILNWLRGYRVLQRECLPLRKLTLQQMKYYSCVARHHLYRSNQHFLQGR